MLTQREAEVLVELWEFEAEHGCIPTYRAICRSCGFRSTNTAFYYVRRFETKGYLARLDHESRSIRLTAQGRRVARTASRRLTPSRPAEAAQEGGGRR